MSSIQAHDVAVIGAGPAGCATALAHARTEASVLLLEANPDAADRLAGEWLHPPAVEILEGLGVDLRQDACFDSGRGFVVFPEDGSAPIRLDYEDGARGWSGEHRGLVDRLRAEAARHPRVRLLEEARVGEIVGQELTFRHGRDEPMRVRAARIIGAEGRSSRARTALGLEAETQTISRMAGLRLSNVELPFEGYGHIFLGGPGPILSYRIRPDEVRICIDVPMQLAIDPATLWDAYSRILPEKMRGAFRDSLREGGIQWAANQVRARSSYGRPGLCLIGDAVGFRHPLTAAGITLGLGDAVALAGHERFADWKTERRRETRVAEMLGGVLHEVFADDSEVSTAIRHGIYSLWRNDPNERARTMRYIAGEPESHVTFARTFARVALPALSKLAGRALLRGDPRRALDVTGEIFSRATWLVRGERWRTESRGGSASEAKRTPMRASTDDAVATQAIQAAATRLSTLQLDGRKRPGVADLNSQNPGGWEGEVVWCPMLAAQFVIFSHLMRIDPDLDPDRRRGLLRHFKKTQSPDGLWGLHPLSPPYLFVTTLVYVACRMLGVEAESPLLARAGVFIRAEGVERIPSWGKFWLALAGLYDWRGVPPVIPEVWALPERLPLHPANYYCHTRAIYLAMSVLYARKPRPPETGVLSRIRQELYGEGFEDIDWSSARRALRMEEVVTKPSWPLRLFYEGAAFYERHHRAGFRASLLGDLEERIRWELRATDHTSLSPVSGLLNILALRSGDTNDPEIKRAIEQLEAWVWHDEADGFRIAGARSASWDTAFALQALATASPHLTSKRDATPQREPNGAASTSAIPARPEAQRALDAGSEFLRRQQIRSDGAGYAEAHRLDPDGGWCFANGWHGWPVSDCTAEAVEGLLASTRDANGHPDSEPNESTLDIHRRAIDFILRTQNHDGGFGSYEARKSRVGLEWLNPAEMFGDSMSEHSYVECTGSCISALANATTHFPQLATSKTSAAIDRAVARLRAAQRADGAWQGVWAVHLVYGTLFGIRGLVAGGAPPSDPSLRRARRWLVEHQREDGGWGESHVGCLDGNYVENEKSQIVQTAWAMLALQEAGESDWSCLTRGARFLMDAQQPDGSWPRQDPAGLFFRTALLEYDLYRQIFPLWALSAYETRRQSRLAS